MTRLKKEGDGVVQFNGITPSLAAESCRSRRADISAAQKIRGRQPRLRMQVTVHQATAEQEQRLMEAIDLYLAAWIRRRLIQ
jgi:hypothetical protein